MKTLRAFVLLTLLGIPAHGDDAKTLQEVQEKRKAAVEKAIILLERDRPRDVDALMTARILLNRVCRNQASNLEQKKLFQAEIVKLKKLRFGALKRDLGLGIEGASRLKVMRAEDQYLAAKQKYLQIAAKANRSAEQGGARQPATAPESKPQGKENLKPESEVRPE